MMKQPDFIVRIPEPCHEDWNSMQPDAKGKFCNSCSKSVVDFSNKTDAEIKHILIEHKDQKVCGHFKKTQVNRPLNLHINIHHLPRNISMTRAFAIALFIVFGTFLFSCTNEKDELIDSVVFEKGNITMPYTPMDTGNYTLGGASYLFYSPDEVIKVQDPLISCTTVSGDVDYEVIEPGPIDSVEQVTPPEPLIMGIMAYELPQLDTTAVPQDSVIPGNTKRLADQPVIGHNSVFSIYPNPSLGEFTIRYDLLQRANVSIKIFNMNGALVKNVVNVNSQYEGQYHIPVNLNELPNGIYIVSLINNGTQHTERVVIQK